jgi:hypothetical protein
METRMKRVLIGGGAICVVAAGVLVAMLAARQSEVARVKQKVVADGGKFSRSVADSVLYLPNIIARSDPDGVVVTLQNDTLDRPYLLDSAGDRLVLEYESAAAGKVVPVALKTGTLAPGETGEPVRVPIDGRWKAMTIQFEHRDS